MKRILYLALICVIASCSENEDKQLKQALQAAGENRKELKIVLEYYKTNSLKLEAASYLIRNMPYHFAKEEYFLSPRGNRCRPDITCFKDKEEIEKHCDSLVNCGYRMVSQIKRDVSSVNANFLIENIELAFDVWQKPWARNVPFMDFCRYILPYRSQVEELSTLRRELMERFVPLLDSAEVTTPLDACMLLNGYLKEEGLIKYRNTGLPLYPTIEDTYYSGISQCDGMCNLGVFIMRSVGIPVTIDQALWSKIDLGHSWCAVLNDGKFYSFGIAEEQPFEHVEKSREVGYRRAAKVYRARFDPFFPDKTKKDDGYRTYLKSPLLYDVTGEYLNKTTNLRVTIDKPVQQKNGSKQVYLCVYNHYQFQPLAVGEIQDSLCLFENVVGDNIFMVAESPDGMNLRYITAPFFADENGDIQKFIPRMEKTRDFPVRKRKAFDQVHTLYYWDIDQARFVPLSHKRLADTIQYYDNIPENALLWFAIPERILNQRVFYIKNDSVKWY